MAIERIAKEDGGMTYVFGPNNVIDRPAWPAAMDASEPANFFEFAADAVGSYMDAAAEISADKRTSDFGKTERLTPKSAEVLEVIARTSGAIDKYEADRDAEEAAMLAVPSLGAGESAEVAIDIEIRQWWRGMDQSERSQYVGKLAAGDLAHQRVALALLRSPVALLDRELLGIRDGWNEARRNANPQLAESLTVAREAIEVARRSLAHLAGRTAVLVRWDRQRMLEALLSVNNEFTHRGVKVYGFTDADVAMTRRRMEAMQRKATFGH